MSVLIVIPPVSSLTIQAIVEPNYLDDKLVIGAPPLRLRSIDVVVGQERNGTTTPVPAGAQTVVVTATRYGYAALHTTAGLEWWSCVRFLSHRARFRPNKQCQRWHVPLGNQPASCTVPFAVCVSS